MNLTPVGLDIGYFPLLVFECRLAIDVPDQPEMRTAAVPCNRPSQALGDDILLRVE